MSCLLDLLRLEGFRNFVKLSDLGLQSPLILLLQKKKNILETSKKKEKLEEATNEGST